MQSVRLLQPSAKAKPTKQTHADTDAGPPRWAKPSVVLSASVAHLLNPSRGPTVTEPTDPGRLEHGEEQRPGDHLRLLSPLTPDAVPTVRSPAWTSRGWITWSYNPSKQSWVYKKQTALSKPHVLQLIRSCESTVTRKSAGPLPPAAWYTSSACTCELAYGEARIAAQPKPQWLLDLWTTLADHVPPVEDGRPPNAARLQVSPAIPVCPGGLTKRRYSARTERSTPRY